jgi:hypothetical protein
MKRALKFVALISLFLGIGFRLPKERLKSGVAQIKARPNIVFGLTDNQMPGTEQRMQQQEGILQSGRRPVRDQQQTRNAGRCDPRLLGKAARRPAHMPARRLSGGGKRPAAPASRQRSDRRNAVRGSRSS